MILVVIFLSLCCYFIQAAEEVARANEVQGTMGLPNEGMTHAALGTTRTNFGQTLFRIRRFLACALGGCFLICQLELSSSQ